MSLAIPSLSSALSSLLKPLTSAFTTPAVPKTSSYTSVGVSSPAALAAAGKTPASPNMSVYTPPKTTVSPLMSTYTPTPSYAAANAVAAKGTVPYVPATATTGGMSVMPTATNAKTGLPYNPAVPNAVTPSNASSYKPPAAPVITPAKTTTSTPAAPKTSSSSSSSYSAPAAQTSSPYNFDTTADGGSLPTAPVTGGSTLGASAGGGVGGAAPFDYSSLFSSAADDAALKAYQDSLEMGPEEVATQKRLNQLNESASSAYVNTEGQAIPLPFITGQQAQLQKSQALLSGPLESQLALLQAKRQLAGEASKFALTREDNRLQALRDFSKPQALAAGSTYGSFSPSTGAFNPLYTAPDKSSASGFTLNPGEVRYDAQGNVIAGSAQAGTDPSAWAQLIQSGQATLSDVPQDIRSAVAQSVAQMPKQIDKKTQAAIDTANTVVSKVQEALKQAGTLTTGLAGAALRNVPGSASYNLDQTIKTIQANLGFQTLQAMREASPTGGALGAVSERELEFLQSTVANLNLGQSKEQLQANLNQVLTHYQNWLATVQSGAAGGGSVQGGSVVNTKAGAVNTSW